MISTRAWSSAEVIEDAVFVVVDDVVQHGVALAERAALGILAGEANRMTFDGQRREGERFGGRPIERLFALGHFLAALDRLLQLLVEMKVLGNDGQLLEQRLQLLDGDARLGAVVWFAAAEVRLPDAGRRWLLGGRPQFLASLNCFSRSARSVSAICVGFFLGDLAELQQVLEVAVADGWPMSRSPCRRAAA